MTRSQRQSLIDRIEDWINDTQEGGEPFDMWVSDTLAARMADAALAVIAESAATQAWLKREGRMKP